MRVRRAAAIIGAILCCPLSAEAGNVLLPEAGGNFTVGVTSYRELRFQSVVRQQYDFSCGSAALAGLLTHHYQDPVSEQAAFDAMYDQGDQEKIRQEGFSLLDMKRYLESRGYRADGFRISLDKLVEVGVPAIALINDAGFKHFVVVKGVKDGDVLVGDPAKGIKRLSRERFAGMWQNGILFLIRNHTDAARSRFNEESVWRVAQNGPLDAAISRQGLASPTLLLPEHSDF